MAITYRTRLITTTPYAVVNDDEVLLVNVAGAASVVLPATGGNEDNKRAVYIKDYSGLAKTNPITITSAGAKTIDGNTFALINQGYAHIQVIYDGTNWKIIS